MIWPVLRCWTTCFSTCQSWVALPGQVCRSSSCIAAGEQLTRPCWLSLPRKNGTSSRRSSLWCRSGGTPTVPGNSRSRPVRSVVACVAVEGDRDPRYRLPAGLRAGQCLGQRADLAGVQRVHVPDDQQPRAVGQLLADLRQPVAARRHVYHVARRHGVVPLVDGADQGQLADAALPLERQPLAALVGRLRRAAGPPPRRAVADQARQRHRRPRRGYLGHRVGGRDQLHVHHAVGEPSLLHRPAEHPRHRPARQVHRHGAGRRRPAQRLGGLRDQHGLVDG